MTKANITVIVPVYNEEKTVLKCLDRVLLQSQVAEVIAVDDASTDGTYQVLLDFSEKENRLKVLRHDRNRGKGTALRTAIAHAQHDITIIQDADLEYDPEEYETLTAPIVRGLADAVYGSRFMASNGRRVLYFWHTVGNHFLTFLSNMFTNLNLTDMETGYKVFRTDLLKSLSLKEKRFGVEAELTAKLAHSRARIYEVAISYHGRTYQEGKKIKWHDGFRAIYCILKYNLFR